MTLQLEIINNQSVLAYVLNANMRLKRKMK